jgi:transaldolase
LTADEVCREICEIVDGPISLQAISLTADEIVKEGRALAKLSPNVVIRGPIIREGLKLVKILAAEGLRTNVTVAFSPLQALLAARQVRLISGK